MRIRGFVLGVALLAAVGWCMVQESIKQTQARYRLAELARQEDAVHRRLEKLKAQEDALRSPARLARLVREQKMNLVALGSALPRAPSARAVASGETRLPGQVLDADFAQAVTEAPERTDMAGVVRY